MENQTIQKNQLPPSSTLKMETEGSCEKSVNTSNVTQGVNPQDQRINFGNVLLQHSFQAH